MGGIFCPRPKKERTMTLSPQLLVAIQTAGASMSDADSALKNSLKDYSEKIATAMGSNPFDIGNDAMFEEWKAVARLSQAVTRIELELRQVFDATSQLAGAKQISPPAPRQISSKEVALVTQVDATDVVAKSQAPLQGNSKAAFAALKPLLNKSDYRKINFSAVATAADLPQGSIGGTLKRLARDGYVVEGERGHFKLVDRVQ